MSYLGAVGVIVFFAMCFAAIVFLVDQETFTSWEMNPALATFHHVLGLPGCARSAAMRAKKALDNQNQQPDNYCKQYQFCHTSISPSMFLVGVISVDCSET